MLGQDIKFNIKGKESHPSFLGLLLSVAVIITTSVYAYFQFMDMKDYNNTQE